MNTTKRNYETEGRERGHAVATWVEIDSSNAAFILAGYEAGDPEVMDIQAEPLSGEWAGESLAELELGDVSDEDLADYENGYAEGFWAEIVRVCLYHLAD